MLPYKYRLAVPGKKILNILPIRDVPLLAGFGNNCNEYELVTIA